MSTQQDIYDAGSENRPPMINKDNYVPWSSHLLRYEKSKPNGKLIYNSIMNGLYVRRMILELGDPDREVHDYYMQQSHPNLKFLPQLSNIHPEIHATILRLIPEDIFDPTTAMNMALVLMAKAFKLNYSTPTKNNQRISSNPRNRQIAQPNVRNQNGYNAIQNVRHQNVIQTRNGNVVAARAKGNGNWEQNKSDTVLQLQRIMSLCQELHCKAKKKGCCFSSNSVVDCSKGRGGNPTIS
ncbi:hypothetical protein Tco_0139126 [Tanacetum coccineum]